jgi:hypothetical protein
LLSHVSYADDIASFDLQSKEAIKTFATTLKTSLLAAMKAGGSIEAINVCNAQAPLIAAELSKQYGMEIGRTSLKVRNSDNAPDSWEAEVLNDFEQRKSKGEPIQSLVVTATEHSEDGDYFRTIKAIPTDKTCLICHGNQISAQTQKSIDTLYPNDQATGFKLGDIRGAFSVKKRAQ